MILKPRAGEHGVVEFALFDLQVVGVFGELVRELLDLELEAGVGGHAVEASPQLLDADLALGEFFVVLLQLLFH